jgi:hypothetical protein
MGDKRVFVGWVKSDSDADPPHAKEHSRWVGAAFEPLDRTLRRKSELRILRVVAPAQWEKEGTKSSATTTKCRRGRTSNGGCRTRPS